MVKKTKEEAVQTDGTVKTSCKKDCCKCSCLSKLKTGTVLVGGFAVIVATIWAMAENKWIQIPSFSSFTSKTGTVVATVDGDPVYMSDVKDLVAQIPQLSELPFEAIYPQLVKDVVSEKVLKKAVKGSNVEKNPIVQQRVNAILFEAYLVEKFKKMVSDEELKQIYLEEIKNFPRQEEVRARHILVKSEKEAKDILVQLKAGADFKILANKKSLDAGSNNGGDLGYFKKEMMIPAFTEPVFALKKGQLSAPIKTSFGWHIVLVEDRRLAAPPSFEETKDFLRKQLFAQKVPELIEDELKRFKAEIKVPSIETKPAETEEEVADMALEQEVLPEETETAEPVVENTTPVVEAPTEMPAEAPAVTPVETPAEATVPTAETTPVETPVVTENK
ncbi:MAG: peptidylprolyl isomerase [Alphaproteobacteria bacterium]|nr:peptidylprolyl isomerase [Alphaproteobacteria bacterium]